MRILLINSNTNSDVTQKIKEEAKCWAGHDTNIDSANAAFGPDIISTRAEAAISQHALLDACARHAGKVDAIIVGMSLDSGVWAARQLMNVPVIGMSEAALHMASLHGNQIGLMVFGNETQTYSEMVKAYGYESNVSAIEALGVTPKEHMRDPDQVEGQIIERCDQMAKAGTIDSVILVGAVAVGLPKRIQDKLTIPAFEGISCAVLLAESLVRMKAITATSGSFARPKDRMSHGLGDELSNLLR